MPRYQFINTTNENDIVDLDCSYEEMLKYASDNPHMQQEFKMTIADPVGISVTKPPSDFSKYIMGRIKNVAGANKGKIEKRWHIPREL